MTDQARIPFTASMAAKASAATATKHETSLVTRAQRYYELASNEIVLPATKDPHKTWALLTEVPEDCFWLVADAFKAGGYQISSSKPLSGELAVSWEHLMEKQ